MTDDRGAAMLIETGDVQAMVCHISSLFCAVCHTKVETTPAILLYRPLTDIYDLVCRECALVVMHAARGRIVDPEYTG